MHIKLENGDCNGPVRNFTKVRSSFALCLVIAFGFLYLHPSSYAQTTSNRKEGIKIAGADSFFSSARDASQPIVVPPISFVDVNSGRFGKLEIELEDAQFLDTAVDKLHLLAHNFDVQAGTLKSLDVDIKGGHVRDFIFDKLTMETAGDLKFDSGVLLNHRLLQFEQPAKANVSVVISQASLNQYLNSPRTLERFSTSATRRAGAVIGLANLVGIKINQIGLNIQSADIKLARHNQFKLDIMSKLGVGELALDINGQVQGELTLEDGALTISNPHLVTAGQDIPPELSNILLKKINLIPALSQQSEDIRFNFTELKVSAGKQIQLRGIAYVSRLRFGNAKG